MRVTMHHQKDLGMSGKGDGMGWSSGSKLSSSGRTKRCSESSQAPRSEKKTRLLKMMMQSASRNTIMTSMSADSFTALTTTCK